MFKLKKAIADEEGASSILEACLIYPVVFIVVIMMFFMSQVYLQRANVNHYAQMTADYIARCIAFTGYDVLDSDPYKFTDVDKTDYSLDEIKTMSARIDPYRYLGGLFGYSSFTATTDKRVDYMETLPKELVEEILTNNDFVTSGKTAPTLSGYGITFSGNGYVCGINANSFEVNVCIKQTFTGIFGVNLFVPEQNTLISGFGVSHISDTPELIRNTDLVFEIAEYWLDKLGLDVDKIKATIDKFMGRG